MKLNGKIINNFLQEQRHKMTDNQRRELKTNTILIMI